MCKEGVSYDRGRLEAQRSIHNGEGFEIARESVERDSVEGGGD
jgi:hypothetical protein